MLRVLEGHTAEVVCVTVIAVWAHSSNEMNDLCGWQDGFRLVSGSVDSTLCVWDSITGACVAVLEGHTDAVEVIYHSSPSWQCQHSVSRSMCSMIALTE